MNDNAKPRAFETLADAMAEIKRRREAEARKANSPRPAGIGNKAEPPGAVRFQDAREPGATSRRRDVLKVHGAVKFRA